MREWSTDAVRAHERFSYWREAICQSIFNLDIEAPAGPFSARLSARSAGAVRIATGESTRYELIRGAREAANDTEALAEAIAQLMREPDMRGRYARNARQIAVDEFSSKHVAEAIVTLYRRLVTAGDAL